MVACNLRLIVLWTCRLPALTAHSGSRLHALAAALDGRLLLRVEDHCLSTVLGDTRHPSFQIQAVEFAGDDAVRQHWLR